MFDPDAETETFEDAAQKAFIEGLRKVHKNKTPDEYINTLEKLNYFLHKKVQTAEANIRETKTLSEQIACDDRIIKSLTEQNLKLEKALDGITKLP